MEEELIPKGIGLIPKEKKKRIIIEDFHTLNTKGLYTAAYRVLFLNRWTESNKARRDTDG